MRTQEAGELGVEVKRTRNHCGLFPQQGTLPHRSFELLQTAVVPKFEDFIPRKCLEQTTPSFFRLFIYSVSQQVWTLCLQALALSWWGVARLIWVLPFWLPSYLGDGQ